MQTSRVPRVATANSRDAVAGASASKDAAPSANETIAAAMPDTDAVPNGEDKDTEEKSDEYSDTMQKKMGTSLTYRHEDGINWNDIMPDLIVGSCLQTPEDVDRLAEAGVTSVFCLQEDCDLEYFNIDIGAIRARCLERGDIKHVRYRIRDFDPHDLRRKLPKAVVQLARVHTPDQGKVYIHCTAGLGRAPAVALAYMFWLRGFDLDPAFEQLRSLRPCSPKIDAVRSATADLLMGVDPIPVTIGFSRTGTAKKVQISGLDVSWHQQLDLQLDPKTDRFVMHRRLLPGTYQYKFIVDGNWTYSMDHPYVQDGNNINNVLTVAARKLDEENNSKQERLLRPGATLTDDERADLEVLLNPWRCSQDGMDDDQILVDVGSSYSDMD